MAFKNKFCSFGKGGFKFSDNSNSFSYVIDLSISNQTLKNFEKYSSEPYNLYKNYHFIPFHYDYSYASRGSVSAETYPSFTIDWGDGTKSVYTNTKIPLDGTKATEPIAHKYSTEKLYKITITSSTGHMPLLGFNNPIGNRINFYVTTPSYRSISMGTVSVAAIKSILSPCLTYELMGTDSNLGSNRAGVDIQALSINSVPYNWFKNNISNINILSTTFPRDLNKISKYIFNGLVNLTELESPFYGNSSLKELPANLLEGLNNLNICSLFKGIQGLRLIPSITNNSSLNKLTDVSQFAAGNSATDIDPYIFTKMNNIKNYSSAFTRDSSTEAAIKFFPPLSIFPNLSSTTTYDFRATFNLYPSESQNAPRIWDFFPDYNNFMDTCCIKDFNNNGILTNNRNRTSFVGGRNPFSVWKVIYDIANYGFESTSYVDCTWDYTFNNALPAGQYYLLVQVGTTTTPGDNRRCSFYVVNSSGTQTQIAVNITGNTDPDTHFPQVFKFNTSSDIKILRYYQRGTERTYDNQYSFTTCRYINLFKYNSSMPTLQITNNCFTRDSRILNYDDIPDAWK